MLGSKVPLLVIPFPLHIPPGSAAVKLTGVALEQKGPAGLIVASALGLTVMV